MADWLQIRKGKITLTVAAVLAALGIIAQYLYGQAKDEYEAIKAEAAVHAAEIAELRTQLKAIPDTLKSVEQKLSVIEQKTDRNFEESSKRIDRVLEIMIKWDR